MGVFTWLVECLSVQEAALQAAMSDAIYLKAHRTTPSPGVKGDLRRLIGRTKGGMNTKLPDIRCIWRPFNCTKIAFSGTADRFIKIACFGVAPMERLDLTDDGLAALVEVFYARVRADAELGPIFNDAIADWPEHLEKLSAFWSSVMLTSGRYKGQPVPAHMKHRDRITPALFNRWLDLWKRTADDLMVPSAAAALQAKAERIAESLQLALFFRLGRAQNGVQAKPKAA